MNDSERQGAAAPRPVDGCGIVHVSIPDRRPVGCVQPTIRHRMNMDRGSYLITRPPMISIHPIGRCDMPEGTRIFRIPHKDIAEFEFPFAAADPQNAGFWIRFETLYRVGRMLLFAGFDLSKTINRWDDIERCTVCYSQPIDIPSASRTLESKGDSI